jgi:hypothetical protein
MSSVGHGVQRDLKSRDLTNAEGVYFPSFSGRGVGGEGRPMIWAVTGKD